MAKPKEEKEKGQKWMYWITVPTGFALISFCILTEKFKYMWPPRPDILGTVSDWALVGVGIVTTYFLWDTLRSQKSIERMQDEMIKLQGEVTSLQNIEIKVRNIPEFILTNLEARETSAIPGRNSYNDTKKIVFSPKLEVTKNDAEIIEVSYWVKLGGVDHGSDIIRNFSLKPEYPKNLNGIAPITVQRGRSVASREFPEITYRVSVKYKNVLKNEYEQHFSGKWKNGKFTVKRSVPKEVKGEYPSE